MKKWYALAVVFLLWGHPDLHAQPRPGFNPSSRPAFSPYLNLNRPDTNPAFNYYGLVKPQINYNNSIQQLQQSTQALQQQEAIVPSELPATGHVSGYLNHNRYFLNRGGSTPLGNRPLSTGPSTSTPRRTTAAAR